MKTLIKSQAAKPHIYTQVSDCFFFLLFDETYERISLEGHTNITERDIGCQAYNFVGFFRFFLSSSSSCVRVSSFNQGNMSLDLIEERI